VGFEVTGKRAAREGNAIYQADKRVGIVTSGTFSPTLNKPIAMGYVQPDCTLPGTTFEIDIRGTRQEARVVPMPFYSREP
jgi:aminomethyltransferase